MTEATVRRAHELRERGLPIHTIAALLGVPHSTLGEHLRGQGETFYDLRCEECGSEMVGFNASKRFCSMSCWRCNYFRDTAHREARRAYNRAWYARNRAAS